MKQSDWPIFQPSMEPSRLKVDDRRRSNIGRFKKEAADEKYAKERIQCRPVNNLLTTGQSQFRESDSCTSLSFYSGSMFSYMQVNIVVID
jgi:hypothetical protein